LSRGFGFALNTLCLAAEYNKDNGKEDNSKVGRTRATCGFG